MKKIRTLLLLLLIIVVTISITIVMKKMQPETSAERPPIHSPIVVPDPLESFTDYLKEGGNLELPVNGASGYASITLRLREGPSNETNIIATLEAGQGFTILEEEGDWWEVKVDQLSGWVMHKFCFINLPDVIPSIIYNHANSYASKMKSSGESIPNVTGQALCQMAWHNKRLGEQEYVVPVLYKMAPKICQAQQSALAEGNTLIIYEGFRPYEVQRKIETNLRSLMNENQKVKEGVTTTPWSIPWFISTGISNHQKGYAIDVSLGEVHEQKAETTGDFVYKRTVDYIEYTMPTVIHELSALSVTFQAPVPSKSDTAWREAKLAATMNTEAILLQTYCTKAGLTPLASEWWHFNDLDCAEGADNIDNAGKYTITGNHSTSPDQ